MTAGSDLLSLSLSDCALSTPRKTCESTTDTHNGVAPERARGEGAFGGMRAARVIALVLAYLGVFAAGILALVLLDTPLPLRPSLSRADKALIKLAELRKSGPAYLVDWARARWEPR